MCAIAGILSRDPADLVSIGKMIAAQAHRGPDGFGFLQLGSEARFDSEICPPPATDGFLALGHARLAVIDLSARGAQPMRSADGRRWVVYNGEIYNHVELRRELEGLGHRFRTDSDTEVLLAAYEQWGFGCFERFNGMWAVAIWDGASNALILSRDRFGVKPLHCLQTARAFYFASEIKGILATAAVAPKLNGQAAIDFLRSSLVNHTDATFFEDIEQVPPGCCAIVDLDGNAVKVQRYWDLNAAIAQVEQPADAMEAADRLLALLQDAVRLRLRSDIAVGSCLSGGLDSSAIVCQMAALRGASAGPGQMTFTAASSDARVDETAWARLVAGRVGADSHVVLPAADAFAEAIPALVVQQDEPFTSASVFAQYLVMRSAQQAGIRVLLDGQGADEILCGYRKYVPFHLIELLRTGKLAAALAEGAGLLLRGDRGTFDWRGGKRYLPNALRRNAGDISILANRSAADLWDRPSIALGPGETIQERQIADVVAFSLPSLLRYEDRNSMAFGVEARTPFLDYRLATYCLALPSGFKLANGRTKAVLRNAVRGLVPDEVIDRRDKVGFTADQERWIRGPLGPLFASRFSRLPPAIEGLVDAPVLQREFQLFKEGKSRLSDADFFRVFALAEWAAHFNPGS